MHEKTPEELADELLQEHARDSGVSLRDLGILDKRRQKDVRKREIPMSSLFKKYRTGHLSDTHEEDDSQ